jgi:hypothetical protein
MTTATQTKYDVGGVLLDRPFKIRRLGHFGFNATNMEACRRFYVDLLDSGVLEAAVLERVRVPREMGYISLNVMDDRAGSSGLLQNRRTIGALAIDILNSLILRNHRGENAVCQSTEVDSKWQPGRTLPMRR